MAIGHKCLLQWDSEHPGWEPSLFNFIWKVVPAIGTTCSVKGEEITLSGITILVSLECYLQCLDKLSTIMETPQSLHSAAFKTRERRELEKRNTGFVNLGSQK